MPCDQSASSNGSAVCSETGHVTPLCTTVHLPTPLPVKQVARLTADRSRVTHMWRVAWTWPLWCARRQIRGLAVKECKRAAANDHRRSLSATPAGLPPRVQVLRSNVEDDLFAPLEQLKAWAKVFTVATCTGQTRATRATQREHATRTTTATCSAVHATRCSIRDMQHAAWRHTMMPHGSSWHRETPRRLEAQSHVSCGTLSACPLQCCCDRSTSLWTDGRLSPSTRPPMRMRKVLQHRRATCRL